MFESGKQEKAFLVGMTTGGRAKWEAEESLEELASLTRTAGAVDLSRVMTEVRRISPKTFLGSGTVERLKNEISSVGATLVIFDVELGPAQNRNLEEAWDVRVIDRPSLILDIFALHAHSREGKLQVELAQYEYLYPRLKGAWGHFSRQRGGGVGLRGPGETQLEVDRRRVRDRITRLKRALEKVESARHIHRRKRKSVPLPTVTLVGYTNAGKSTLFNAITHSNQVTEDKLFATLDPKTKRVKLPSGREALLTDTVGFIRRLPYQLIEAFKSTFEEARGSDLLVHVADASRPDLKKQMDVVDGVLSEIGLDSIPVVYVFNKTDIFAPDTVLSSNGGGIPVSAVKGDGVAVLLSEIDLKLSRTLTGVRLFLPHPYGRALALIYANGRVLDVKTTRRGVVVEADLPEKWQKKLACYSVPYHRRTRPTSTCTKPLPG